jgi:hypothetical protein
VTTTFRGIREKVLQPLRHNKTNRMAPRLFRAGRR